LGERPKNGYVKGKKNQSTQQAVRSARNRPKHIVPIVIKSITYASITRIAIKYIGP